MHIADIKIHAKNCRVVNVLLVESKNGAGAERRGCMRVLSLYSTSSTTTFLLLSVEQVTVTDNGSSSRQGDCHKAYT